MAISFTSILFMFIYGISMVKTQWNPMHISPPILNNTDQRFDFPELNFKIDELKDKFFEGDMIITEEQKAYFSTRKALPPDYYWNRTIYYYLGNYPENHTALPLSGIDHWEQNTCLDFQEITDPTSESYFLNFISTPGCWSYLGVVEDFKDIGQNISLHEHYCNVMTIAAHEIGHAIGFFHEQSRSDRDEYIDVIWENIVDGYESNFNMYTFTENYGLQYDYMSAMHYNSLAFSKNGGLTISAKDPVAQPKMGRIDRGLSFYDIKMANLMYSCIETYLLDCELVADPCLNEGFLFKDCQCLCRPGTSGQYCENDNESYIDAETDPECHSDEIITTAGVFETPNYPNPYEFGYSCTKIVRAPYCMNPVITILDMQLYQRYFSAPFDCYFESLEIRFADEITAKLYCGTEANGKVFTTNTTDEVYLIHSSKVISPGFQVNITFKEDPHCALTQIRGNCNPEDLSIDQEDIIHWHPPISINNDGYPDNYACHFTTVSTKPRAMELMIDMVDLEKNDFVTTTVLGSHRKFTNSIDSPKIFNYPVFDAEAVFYSNHIVHHEGFHIMMLPVEKECYELYIMEEDEIKTFTATAKQCQWYIVAPKNYNVKLYNFAMSNYKSCRKDYFLVATDIKQTYRRATTYCDAMQPPEFIISEYKSVKIMSFKKTRRATLSFNAKVVQMMIP